ncbi:MBOAT, membrane-bound O-acyltransferase family-domain-containing protein [Macrophomina phaseolina]|uniref:O-acyltransferase n=1 Tax=Macrophomina phaseolina TaxID=35725 RepID=A0ABQ8G7X7_9PEZI|nr:MBOAT, membrane-bound O-acyltransferase family-domain-containing protein [Macrophomina phaseolina]
MATTSSFEPATANGHATPEIVHPRARKPEHSQLLRAATDDITPSGLSSGRSTPVPADAPPSVHATSSARRQIRAQQKQRLFPTIEYAARVSHFDPRSDYRDFRGFFVLFWVGLAIMVFSNMVRHYKETGYPLSIRQWNTFTANIWEMGLSDVIMCASTAVSLPLHKLYDSSKGDLRWSKNGMLVQSIFQGVWIVFWTLWPFVRGWTWTAQVFFILHYLVLFMKMHSYAFYNGHLSETRRRLQELDHPENASMDAARKYPSAQTHLNQLTPEEEKKNADLTNDESLAQLRDDLAHELISPLGNVSYPKNLTIYNYVDYLFCPTLCYELEYPRTKRIRKSELFFKTLAVFGCIFLLTFVTEQYVMPALDIAAEQLELPGTVGDRTLIVLETISRLLFPFVVIFLLVFLVIFEYALGAFAEMTCFADRHFYSDWWNSCDWLEFSREWNIPVHRFLRRHVYSASRPRFSRSTATIITFLISAAAHELVMGCITKKLRGYGAFAMMLQIPIVAVQRSKPVRGRTLLNVSRSTFNLWGNH